LVLLHLGAQEVSFGRNDLALINVYSSGMDLV